VFNVRIRISNPKSPATLLLMQLVGLTGGVGMGKSTCAQLLRERQIPVVDTDDVAHELVEPGQPALKEIGQAFGAEMLDAEGRLRRAELARRVFHDPAARRRLEAILHPPIRERWRAQADAWRAQSVPLGVVVIPLLFETDAQKELDATICLACSPKTQIERLQPRGWSWEQLEQRIAAQWPIEKKIAAADYVIWTEGPLAIHAAQLDGILERFK
jgi:dephospho-CoA kinase